MSLHDLDVEVLSDSLEGVKISVVVCGSIGAVEAPKFIRSLRRLGAVVSPYLTDGGRQFTTEVALSWASAGQCIREFSGTSSHLADADACVVAPASASFIHKIASGALDSPGSCLVASFLGQGKPVLLLPNMHDSLYNSPAVQENLGRISRWLDIVEPRSDEGKKKFIDPATLADIVSHKINVLNKVRPCRPLITMGTTRGYIDEVRYISNYSSGALGTEITHESYRQGMMPTVVVGPCKIQPRSFSSLVEVNTNAEMEYAGLEAIRSGCGAVVMAASVLDFVPEKCLPGKVSSQSDLQVDFRKTSKIISALKPIQNIKIGFKLESDLTPIQARAIAEDYISKYDLSMIVVNSLKDVSEKTHSGLVFSAENGKVTSEECCYSKQEIAARIVKHIEARQ